MSESKQRPRVVVIGGGISGLAAAFRLRELSDANGQDIDLKLLEAGPRLGGALKTIERDDFLIEGGADSFISEKVEAINLAARLGIAERLIETKSQNRRSFIVRNGKLRAVPEGFQLMAPSRLWPFVTTDIFSWRGKVRMGLEAFVPQRKLQNGSDDESLADFVRRRLGREALERMAQPMIGGIYTANPETLSLRATLPRFLEMERKHGSVIRAMWRQRKQGRASGSGVSGARYSLFLSFDRGMQVLVDELAGRLKENAKTNQPVESLSYDDFRKHWLIRLEDQSSIESDHVCVALPAYRAGSLLAKVDNELSHLLNKISFASTATINLAFRRSDIAHPLDGFGFVVPFIEKRSILACSFSSVKFPGRAPADHVLLRAFAGGALQPEMFELDDAELLRRTTADLRDLLGISQPPLFTIIERWRRSMPQYQVGHLVLMAQINARLKSWRGLQLAGNSYDGVGIPDCIRSGEHAAEALTAWCRSY
jgi:oxygen-dependent protoporphyrinogen oxidase